MCFHCCYDGIISPNHGLTGFLVFKAVLVMVHNKHSTRMMANDVVAMV